MRLLRYLPIALPFIVRYLRSPNGKAMVNRFLNRGSGGSSSARRR